MEPLSIALLAVAALLTSALTGVAGLGGGIILLAVMLAFFEPMAAIPLHAAVQLVSNGSRTWIQREHVERSYLGLYAAPLVPLGWVGMKLGSALDADLLGAAIGVFVLLAVWAPRALLLGARPEQIPPRPRFALLGALVGLLSTTVGATGPLQGAFFTGLSLSRQGMVGTFAACQALSHLAKIAVFGLAGFAFVRFAPLLALLCAMVVLGTWLGSRLLDRASERTFGILYRVVLTAVALHLVWVDGGAWLRGG
jgi:uncharacterized membrane protein YfcA